MSKKECKRVPSYAIRHLIQSLKEKGRTCRKGAEQRIDREILICDPEEEYVRRLAEALLLKKEVTAGVRICSSPEMVQELLKIGLIKVLLISEDVPYEKRKQIFAGKRIILTRQHCVDLGEEETELRKYQPVDGLMTGILKGLQEEKFPGSCADTSTVRDVTKVYAHNNVLWNAEPGNAIELGYGLQSEIHDLVFEDCDIIHCQYEGNMGGAAISIHQADGGHVHDVHYRNIRVEQAEQKLFDIKVLLCKYTQQVAKGEINDIHFDNIQVLNGDIPVSLIRGYQSPTEEVRVHDIYFDNVSFMGQKCETWQDLRLVTELANDIYVNGVRTCKQMKF